MVQPGPPASWREPRHREGRAPAAGTGKTMKKKEIKLNLIKFEHDFHKKNLPEFLNIWIFILFFLLLILYV